VSGAQMAVFPELYLPGYNQPNLHHPMAQPKAGPWEQELSKMAADAGCGITIGWAEGDNGRFFNSASCYDQTGQKLAHYRKYQLFGPMEKANFEFGDTHSVFELSGCKTALLICYDVEFSHHVHSLRKEGVELILVPTANPAQYENVSKLTVPARALEANVTIAYANYCGTEGDLAYGGSSIVVGPDGEILAKAGRGETLLITDLGIINEIDPTLLSTQIQDLRKLS